jgi:hypothetical protein
MIKMNPKGRKLIATMTFFWAGNVFAQVLVPTDGSVGVFRYSAQMPRTWISTSATLEKAREVLSKDQVQMQPSFAYEGPKGNLLFGTWKVLKPGVAFTAAQLSSDPPQFPDDWGMLPKSLNSLTGATESGIEYSGFSALGAGDGRNFIKGRPVRTFGAWFDMPVSYQDENGIHSGLASIYYRSTEAESTNASAGVKFAQNLLSKLQLAPGISKITAEQYKLAASKNEKQVSPTISKIENNATSNSYVATSKTDVASTDIKFNSPAVGILYDKDGGLYCYNFGVILKAPCSLAQPGVGKAEVNSLIINQLNTVASRKIN